MLSLTPARLRKWHGDIAAASPRLRTKPGNAQKMRDTNGDPEAPRRRRATANRILTVLKAALNHAWREGKIPSGQTAHGGALPLSAKPTRHGSAISIATSAAGWSTPAPIPCAP